MHYTFLFVVVVIKKYSYAVINGNKKVKDHQICIFESREAIRVATDTLILREMSISKNYFVVIS